MKRKINLGVVAFTVLGCVAILVPRSATCAPCQNICAMHDMPGTSAMPGQQPDMTAMGPHMTMTPTMPGHPGDARRADEIVKTLRLAIEKYKDYRIAERDGFKPFLANVPQLQYHFTNWQNAVAAEFGFDPARPTSLLYQKTPAGYALRGAMYTAPRASTLADLDARVPLSVARWHEHVNFCKAPPGAGQAAYFGPNARFGLAGSIATEDACRAAGGTFAPVLFNWMVHVYPWEPSAAQIWKAGH